MNLEKEVKRWRRIYKNTPLAAAADLKYYQDNPDVYDHRRPQFFAIAEAMGDSFDSAEFLSYDLRDVIQAVTPVSRREEIDWEAYERWFALENWIDNDAENEPRLITLQPDL